jgi:misacylated tRNA(Ala) deacylase
LDALYLTDAYRRAFSSRVVASLPEGLVLETTAFYPEGGGQPCDRGTLHWGEGRTFPVLEVRKTAQGIVHRGEGEPPPIGAEVAGQLDWARRYAHMRYHTCLHILSGVVFHRFGSGITGGQIYQDRARMDLSLPDLNAGTVEEILKGVNRVVEEDRPIRVRFLAREEAERDPSLVRVARELMPEVDRVRLIDIEGFDVQADGGTHVRSTREVGPVRLLRLENKGTRNKRLYLTLSDPEGTATAGKA